MLPDDQTVAAISTGLGGTAIGIVRASGDLVRDLWRKVFVPSDGRLAPEGADHRLVYGFALDSRGDRIDECLATLMLAPRSYTTEDVLEVQCHGGPAVLGAVLESMIAAGARVAEPGEFTRRAFAAGRIDLVQAEAVARLVSSQTREAARAAVEQLSGTQGRAIRLVMADVVRVVARIEAGTEFPEEVGDLPTSELMSELAALAAGLRDIARAAEVGTLVAEGVPVVLVGKPNVGKSSLFNAVLGRERALVAPAPGTTRDVIDAEATVGGLRVRLLDTAGIRETLSAVEVMGVAKARAEAERGDLVILVGDLSRPVDESDAAAADLTRGKDALLVLNKSDLAECPGTEEALRCLAPHAMGVFRTSIAEGLGVREVVAGVSLAARRGALDVRDEAIPLMLTAAQSRALDAAVSAVASASGALTAGLPADIVGLELRAAVSSLATTLGEVADTDIIQSVFSQFCLGK